MSQCGQCGAVLTEAGERCESCGHLEGEPPDELVGSEVLGRYRIVRLLAEGGMGRVYVAQQSVGTAVRQVAIKVLRRQLGADPQLASRFGREAETLVRLTHPNTVQLFDFGALADGTLALVMEYVKGHSLASELRRGPLSTARVQRILTQIGGALKEAHAHGIFHRDLKPDNVLIADREGHADFVKVLDFGIASVSEPDAPKRTRLTQQGMMIGTPPYMSPEQFMGEKVDARSDIYSLALIAYELLSGRLPFEANTPWEWASKHMTQAPAPLTPARDAQIAGPQVRAVHRALQKRPDDRPATVDQFLAEFAGEAAPPTRASPPGDEPAVEPANESASMPRPHKRTGAMLAGLAAAVLVVALGAHALRGRDAVPPAAQAASMSTPTTSVPGLPTAPSSTSHDGRATLPLGASTPDDLPAAGARAGAARDRGRTRPRGMRDSERSSATLPTLAAREEPLPRNGSHAAIESAPASANAQPASPSSTARQSAAKSAVPPDLQERVAAIREAAARKPELAVGLYQAAAARYGRPPLLEEARELLRMRGRARVEELLAAGRCPQAQALQRALGSIHATSQGNSPFGGACPPP